MKIYPNQTKRRLLEGGIAIGLGLHQSRLIDIAAIGKTCGFDWLFIDMEHSGLSVDCASQIAAAALPLGITPLVRVPGKEHHHASRMLDCGAQGIVVPHVDSVEEARRVVATCKYPPLGQRSLYGLQPQFRYEGLPIPETMELANQETLVVVMLESPQAIDQVDEIAAIPGVDALLIGTNDYYIEAGIPGRLGDAKVEAAYRAIVGACRKHGKWPGMGGVVDPVLIEKYIDIGMRLILSGNDIGFLMAGARQRVEFLRGLKVTTAR